MRMPLNVKKLQRISHKIKQRRLLEHFFQSSGRIILAVRQKKLFFCIELSIAEIGMCYVRLEQ